MSPFQPFQLSVLIGALGVNSLSAAALVENPLVQLRHPSGFFVQQIATDEQVHDVRTIALDSQNQLFASSRGWIKKLVDTDDNGQFDEVSLFAHTTSGASGMVFVGTDLYALADGYFCRYLDSDADGTADGPPQRFFEFSAGEGGAHSLRRGPDGSWYILVGPHANLNAQHWNHPTSPIRNPEAGALVHISADLSRSEVLAEGFYNARDFDFHAVGATFAPDSALMLDKLMPWHVLPRLFHVAHTSHHGWKQPGPFRPWSFPDYYPDQVNVNWSLGGNVGTGIEFYRHHQFPKDFRNGAFVCDWENGNILHVQPLMFQSSFTSTVNIFIEPIGRNGFTPTDLAVEQDGSLLIASGGRGTSGGVYRVKYTLPDPDTGKLPDQPPPYLSNLDAVLRPPQRSELWSRAKWMPLAHQQGRGAFEEVAMSLNDPEEYKLVAVEVLTEMFGGLDQAVARMTSKSRFDSVRARTAWSIARYPYYGHVLVLNELSVDQSPFVRRAALEAVLSLGNNIPVTEQLRMSQVNLGHDDQRVRGAAITIASKLPDIQWQLLTDQMKKQKSLHRLGVAMASIERTSPNVINEFAIDEALRVLGNPEKGTPLLGLMSARVLMRSFGDWNLEHTTAEAFAPFELSLMSPIAGERTTQIVDTIRPLFPTGGAPLLDAELARLLGMFGDTNPEAVARVLTAFSQQSPVTSDIHYLAAITQLNPATPPNEIGNLAQVLLWLDDKAGITKELPIQEWKPRVIEIATRLIEKHPIVGSKLLGQPHFGQPQHAYLANALLPSQQDIARQIYSNAFVANPKLVWTPELVELMAEDASESMLESIRDLWNQGGLREAIVRGLAVQPDARDREKYLAALNSSEPETVEAAVEALATIEEAQPENVVGPMMRVLYGAASRPDQKGVRAAVVSWLKKHAGLSIDVVEMDNDIRSLEVAYGAVFAWFETSYRKTAVNLFAMDEDRFDFWQEQLRSVPWTRGKIDRGKKLFAERQCADCHSGGNRYGPDLVGVTERHTPVGLMRTILYPHLDVTERDSLRNIVTKDGARHTGVIIFESPQTVILQTEEGNTVRLRHTEIQQRMASHLTSMPLGLMKRANARDLADLYAYLKTLN